MEVPQKPPPIVGQVTICHGASEPDKMPGVMLMLDPAAIGRDLAGEPCPAVFLLPWMARRVAYMLLLIAEEQEVRERLGLTT